MSGETVRIEIAAGAGDEGDAFGTSAPDITTAIEHADDGDGVVVLLDMGSAIMNAEMALEFVDPGLAERTRLLSAPFVEGAVSAAVAASGKASIDQVVEQARTALQQKSEALDAPADAKGPPGTDSATSDDATSASSAKAPAHEANINVWDAEADVEVINEHGLHARPAARFVRTAMAHTHDEHGATVQVRDMTNGNGPVDATSQSTVTTLGAVRGHQLRIQATGPGAQDIVDALCDLVASGFGEAAEEGTMKATPRKEDESGAPVETAENTVDHPDASAAATHVDSMPYTKAMVGSALRGIVVQGGAVSAPAFVHRPSLPDIPEDETETPDESWADLTAVLDAVSDRMEKDRSRLQSQGHTDAADILGAQQLLLDDPALRNRARANIQEKRYSAPRAWMEAVEEVIEAYASAEDAYLSQRADDVRDVAVRVLHVLMDVPPSTVHGPDAPHVFVTRRIRPSDVPALDEERVQAVVCAEGNATSHSAILLRGRGIATLFDVGPDVLAIDDGTQLALDADEGLLWIDPSEKTRERVGEKQRQQQAAQRKAEKSAHKPAVTDDGTRIAVHANISQISDAQPASQYGAEGVGLLRTEFLFSGVEDPPSETDQLDALLQVCTAMDRKPVTVRALDAGGDKPLRFLPLPDESNPFLGLRGIRVLLRHPDLFLEQLRAVLRLRLDVDVRLMLPMVCTPAEVRETRTLLSKARKQLDDRGLSSGSDLPLGTMIETPASALAAGRIAEEVDFFSIGTNDLAQYTMAADREHGGLGSLTDALHPPVLRLVQQTVEAAHASDISASVCGAVAGDRLAIPILLGLGVRTLSLTPKQIPSVKALIRQLPLDACRDIADEALNLDDADAVREQAKAHLSRLGVE